jgi:hypothetical protein
LSLQSSRYFAMPRFRLQSLAEALANQRPSTYAFDSRRLRLIRYDDALATTYRDLTWPTGLHQRYILTVSRACLPCRKHRPSLCLWPAQGSVLEFESLCRCLQSSTRLVYYQCFLCRNYVTEVVAVRRTANDVVAQSAMR